VEYNCQTPDYATLIAEARALDTSACTRDLRIAVLADFTTHQLVAVMQALAARRGVRLHVYEAAYDSIESEILDAASGLYAFAPDCVALLAATPKLKGRYYAAADPAAFAGQAVARFAGLWDGLRAHCPATIIQSTYVQPAERAFGQYEALVPHSLGAAVREVNRGLAEAARARRGVLLCDADFLAAERGRAAWRDERLWALAKLPCTPDCLPDLAGGVLDAALAAAGAFVKCVVLDLDNTLWGGVIGDDGLAGIALGGFDEGEAFVAFQQFLLSLKRRGILLAVVSKNEEAAARLPFREHPDMVLKEEDIAVFLANWDNKADNIRRVQQVLNIGLDAMVFLDDNPFERQLVRAHVPGVIVPELPEDPVDYLPALAALNLFETASHSDADAARAGQYREEASRQQAQASFTNIDDYLRSLGMTARLERFAPRSLPRIAQLIQRSNQFNLTTRRHSEEACARLMADAGHAPLTITLADTFGDYGLISVIVLALQGDTVEILDYLMSCRVLKRGVEDLAMNAIFAFAAQNGARQVVGRYLPTAKNRMVEGFYAGFGFTCIDSAAHEAVWAHEVASWRPRAHFIHAEAQEWGAAPQAVAG